MNALSVLGDNSKCSTLDVALWPKRSLKVSGLDMVGLNETIGADVYDVAAGVA